MVRKLDRKKLRAIDFASLMPEALDGLVQEKLLIEVMLNEAQLHAN